MVVYGVLLEHLAILSLRAPVLRRMPLLGLQLQRLSSTASIRPLLDGNTVQSKILKVLVGHIAYPPISRH